MRVSDANSNDARCTRYAQTEGLLVGKSEFYKIRVFLYN